MKYEELDTIRESLRGIPFVILPRAEVEPGIPDAKIEELQDTLKELAERMIAIRARADTEHRDLSEDEDAEMASIFADSDHAEKEMKSRQRIVDFTARLSQGTGRKTTPEGPTEEERQFRAQGGERPRKQENNIEFPRRDPGKSGFKNVGEFALAVRASSRQGSTVDPRLIMNAPSTYQQEGVGADGGFAVPPDFRQAIMSKIGEEMSLYARTDQQQTTSNNMTFPLDETSQWQTTGAVRAYWEGEAQLKAQSKTSLTGHTTRLHKIIALVPMTDELIEDAPAMTGFINKKAPLAIDFVISLAIVSGDGVGKPLGILNSPATISVAKETSQVADTVVAENVNKMWARMPAANRANAVWIINQDVEPQFEQMSFKVKNVAGTENVGGWPLYMPPGGISAAPFATLKGRPVLPGQYAETVGDKGDIILADLSQYLTITKVGGIRQDVSIHLWFDYDVTAFRFVLRIGGQPWWTKVLQPRVGSTTYSPFVTLDDRA